ncbi:MAG: transglutaminase family protein [Burkholderiales bacterium]
MSSELRWLHVQHDTRYEYDAAVELAHHLAHLRPRATPWQQVRDIRLVVSPAPDGEAVHDSLDVFGNWRTVFTHAQVHDSLLVSVSFRAGLEAPPALDVQRSPPWESVAERLRYRAGKGIEEAEEFVLPSAYVPPDPALARYAQPVCAPRRPLLDVALALMRKIHDDFEYQPAATSVATHAGEALAQRAGVCQDFAHVMIGALRSMGLAARYVSGYLLTQPPPGQPRLVGADASHAWVAVWCPVLGWVPLDPTNAVPVALDHVTLAWGRDYADVAPLRGVIRGGGQAVPQVAVTVEEVGAPGEQSQTQSQSQQ